MAKIVLNSLSLVLTHKCNLSCAHCMRGESSSESISDEVLEAIFNNVKRIDLLTLTGGEPFLEPSKINKINDIKPSISLMNIITNGTIYNEDIMNSILKLKNNIIEDSLIAISNDYFHNEEIKRLNLDVKREEIMKQIELFCYQNNIKYKLHDVANRLIIDEGRAVSLENKIKNKIDYKDNKIRFKWTGNGNYYNGDIMIDCDGKVIALPNISFEDMNKYSIGNILEEDLDVILDKEYQKEFKY